MRAVLGGLAVVAMALTMSAVSLPAHAQRYGGTIDCGSSDNRPGRCPVPWRDARLIRQDSNSPCIRDRTWGVDRDGIWVDRGCRGIFADAGGGWGGGRPGWSGDRPPPPPPGWGDRPSWGGPQQTIDCGSSNGRWGHCNIDTRGRVRLVRQNSDSRCDEGRTWGVDGSGIWVDKGCRGIFSVGGR
ncbi:DUF3011 domain-containing protein [Luteibacter anthropi]|uniref:DUF3011 domain-containing protein n=1 Tax=Luteibacter anthropi TaxID=564369 RepID=UPI0020330F56|nr:DUF3011 domain-containing protein [Luteibacter anthropi]